MRLPMLNATPMVPLAHSNSSSPARLGSAAPNAGWPTRPTIDAMNATLTSATGPLAAIKASEHAAAARSDMMMSRRRSKRSASQPATGVRSPVIPKLRKYQADNQTADPVRSYKKKPNATAIALEPSESTSPPVATR
jgi:hypothetical protein